MLLLNVVVRNDCLLVQGFGKLRGGKPGPAERCGKIRVGDHLVAIDDAALFPNVSIPQQLKIARQKLTQSRGQDETITLTLRRWVSGPAFGELCIPVPSPEQVQAGFVIRSRKRFLRNRATVALGVPQFEWATPRAQHSMRTYLAQKLDVTVRTVCGGL